MATALARFAQAPEASLDDVRIAPRPAAQRQGQLRSAQGDNALIVISDVSAHGCCARCAAGWLRPGRFVSVGLGDGPPLQAIVRWVRDDLAGLEFLRAVPRQQRDWHGLIALDC